MRKLVNNIDLNKLKLILICTLIFMVVAHGYCYVNLNFSHDSMRTFFWTKSDTLEIGRYMIPVFLLIRGKYYPPLLVGTLTYLFLSIIIYILVDIFKVRRKLNIILISGILSTASTLTLLNATYIDFSDVYMFGILLMTLGSYICIKMKRGYIYAIIPVLISLALYQSYICFFIGIIMLFYIKEILDNKNTKEIFIRGLKSIITIIVSLIIYAISLKVVTLVTGIGLANKYNSVSGIGNFGSINNMFNLLIGTYQYTYHYIINPSTYYKTIVSILNILMLIIAIGICILSSRKNKLKNGNKYLLLILTLLLPFGINMVYFIGKGIEHELMIYSLFLLYVFMIAMLEYVNNHKSTKNKNPIKYITYFTNISLFLIIFSGVIYSNQCYLKKNLEFDTTLTTMNRVVDRIEQIEGYEVGKTKVAIIGSLANSKLSLKRREFDYEAVGLGENFSLTYYKNYKQYFENYLSYPINIVPEEKSEKYKNKQAVKKMKEFPHKDSIKMIGDTIIVKLSMMDN